MARAYICDVDEAELLVTGVRKSFGAVDALAPVTFAVPSGSFTSIVGPSGCGKSTLFNIVSGLIVPDAGTVTLSGRDVTGQTGHVGYMLQKDLLVPWRTVLGNITLGATLTRRVTTADRDEAVSLAHQYGLGPFLAHYPRALSGGMRQRVALMRTLVTHQEILLLDEPFGALDAQTRVEMQQWLLTVWRDTGRTILFITHDVDEAIFLSDRVLVMSARPGDIVEDLPVALSRPRTLDSLTAPEFMDAKRSILTLIHAAA